MTFSDNNDADAQGATVIEQKSTAKTKKNQTVSAIDAMLAKHSKLIEESNVAPRTTVDWFVPHEDGSEVNTVYKGIADVNGNNQIMFEVNKSSTYVRLPDDLGAFVGGKSNPSSSYGSCKRLINILRDVSRFYDKRLTQLFSIAYDTYMVADDYVDQKGLIFERDFKDTYGNKITKKLVWTMDKRNAMQSVINDFVAYISAEGVEHKTIPMTLSARSRNGYSAIIESID